MKRNKRVFSSSTSSTANIHFHILHLYKFWTDSFANLEHLLTVSAMPGLHPSVSSASQPRVGFPSVGAQPINPNEGEDLLD
jgi:hypothetical protein